MSMITCEIHINQKLSKNNICRICYNKQYGSKYYKNNKSELDKKNREWVINNRESSRAIKRYWKKRNPNVDRERYERVKDTQEYKERVKRNHDKFIENNPNYYKEWREANPEKKLAYYIRALEQLLPHYTQLKDSWDMAYALKHWADSVKKRDGHTCQNCGAKHRIHAHHVLYPKLSYPTLVLDLSNGVSFCRDCHEAYHQLFDVITNPNT